MLIAKQFRSHGGEAGLRRRWPGAAGWPRGAGAVRAARRAGRASRRSRRSPGWCGRALLEVLEPAPRARARRRALYFRRCGGCHYQHAPYEYQLHAKRAILAEDAARGWARSSRRRRSRRCPASRGATAIACSCTCEGEPLGLSARRARTGCAPSSSVPSPRRSINEAIAALTRDAARSALAAISCGRSRCSPTSAEVQLNVLETDRPVARRFFDWCAEMIPGPGGGRAGLPDGALSREPQFVFPGEPVSDRPAGGDGAGRARRARRRWICTRAWACSRCRWRGGSAQVTAVESGAAPCAICNSTPSAPGWRNRARRAPTAEEYLAQLEARSGFRAARSAARGAGQGRGARGWRELQAARG